MAFLNIPGSLLDAFLEYGDIGELGLESKKALRLCSKGAKAAIDATPVSLLVRAGQNDLEALAQCTWKIVQSLIIRGKFLEAQSICSERFEECLQAFFCKHWATLTALTTCLEETRETSGP